MSKEIDTALINSSNLEKAIKKGLGIAQNAREIWASSDYDDKQRLQYLIYPEGIWYNKREDAVRTPKMNSLFSLIAGSASVLKENKNGRFSKSSRYDFCVVLTGLSSKFWEDVELLINL
jgi:site-specific DNA recombinase